MAPELPTSALVTFVAAVVAAVIVRASKGPNLDAIPTVGPSDWLGSWWAGIKFMTNAADMAEEGYRKYKGAPFKIATPHRWVVVVGSRTHLDDMRNAHHDNFSHLEPVLEDYNAEFMMGTDVVRNFYHVMVIRSQLTRNLGVLFPEVRDEIIVAFNEVLGLGKDNEWKSIPALTAIQQIVCRASSRVFVGLPLCRNPDYIALSIKYTDSIASAGGIIVGFFPTFLKAWLARIFAGVLNTNWGLEYLRPIIEERQRNLKEYGNDWAAKPKDLLSWVMDEAGPDATVDILTRCVLGANFAVIHTSANIFTKALYNLAAYPQYVQPLREEVETLVEKEGWSKSSIAKMHRVDSFLKETIRMEGIEILGSTRKATRDFTFSDGMKIPKGTRIYTPITALHQDDTLYENSRVFNPFRFAEMPAEDGSYAKHQFSATSPEYLSFGHGHHACPGRFFAALELKTMLAHILTTYDVKLEKDMGRPQSLHVGTACNAHPTARVMFRHRIRCDGN